MAIEIDYINPVITALEDVFKTMLGHTIKRTGLGLMENNCALHPVSGIIGVSGKAVGTIVLSMSHNVARKAAGTLLMTEITETSDDVLDAVGELTNMVTGSAKAKLEAFDLRMSLPNVLCGENCRLHFPPNAQPIAIPFQCEWGPLALEIGFSFPTLK
ncbi:MAG: chemotaxis protein CheX [Planctomycetaceae bacterium]|nr:chemotaxis protein CheX [Planctomycetaceae bacterium]